MRVARLLSHICSLGLSLRLDHSNITWVGGKKLHHITTTAIGTTLQVMSQGVVEAVALAVGKEVHGSGEDFYTGYPFVLVEIYVCIYMYNIYVYYTHAHIRTHTHTCIYIYMLYIYICMLKFIILYICMYVYMY